MEFFEFSATEGSESTDFRRAGYFHVYVVDPDVEGLMRTIEEHGGEHHTDVWRLYENDPDYTLTFCRDPFGNLIEIYSHSHEQMHVVGDESG